MDFPFIKEAVSQLFGKSSCAMYPAVPSEAAEGYRGRIVYHPERCIACGMCERVCSGNAITRSVEHLEDGQDKITLTFNLGSCTFCASCADFCAKQAIEFTRDYHMIATSEEDLLVRGSFIKAAPKKKAPGPAKQADCQAQSGAGVKPRDDGKPVSDPSRCVYCTICARKCPVQALTVDRAAKTWVLDEEKCIACGTCAQACPKNCIIQ